MQKSAQAFRSIGEVSQLIGVATHVLRYWETQFPQLKPMKRPDGRRYYRPDDVLLIAGLCEVLRDDGMTIRGARKILQRDRGRILRERGAVRLGEDLLDSDDLPDGMDPVEGPGLSDSDDFTEIDAAITADGHDPAIANPFPAGVGQGLAETDHNIMAADDDTASEDDLFFSAHAPRARHRRRRGPSSVHPQADPASWLSRLTRLSANLRMASSQNPGWHDARDAANALRNAIAASH